MTSKHISHEFDEEVDAIREKLQEMSGLCRQQIKKAMKALLEQDKALASEVIENDKAINDLEVEIDGLCATVLARRQPAAYDLRLVMAIIKTITDLERIGDEAVSIAQAADKLSKKNLPKGHCTGLKNLGKEARKMLADAMTAFANEDCDAALAIARRDESIDIESEQLIREIMTYLLEDEKAMAKTREVLSVAHALQRIADHACNICEYVIYVVKGKDVRHAGTAGLAEAANRR